MGRSCEHPGGIHHGYVPLLAVPEGFCANHASAAFQALVLVGDIKRGDDVLIHAAASGVGIAAIQLARFYGA